MAQPKAPVTDLGKLTTGDFKNLNVKPEKAWATSEEATRALAEFKRAVTYGGSSSIKEEGRVAIPKEGGPDSARNGG